jgi:hypothetical protein
MKNLIKFFALVLFTAILQNCDVEPTYYSKLAPEEFFDSQEKVMARYYSAFANWSSNYGGVPRTAFTSFSTYTCDETIMPNRAGDWYDGGVYMVQWDHSFPIELSDSYGHNTVWQAFSSGVSKALNAYNDLNNYVNFEDTTLHLEPGTKEKMLGNLNVLMASYYIQGLDHFGGLPLYTELPEEAVGRSTDEETFLFIEKLLTDALASDLSKRVKGESNTGAINQGVAAALLARLYFNAQPYTSKKIDKTDECITLCQDILNGKYGYYELAKDYRDIFGYGNETCDELIWAVPSEPGIAPYAAGTPHHGTHYNTKNYIGNPNFESWNGYCLTPSKDIDGKHYRYERGNLGGPFKLGCPYEKYEANDIRKEQYLFYGDNATYKTKYGSNYKYKGMFLADTCINPITKTSITGIGSRQYQSTDTVPMVDQIAQLAPDIPQQIKYRNAFYNLLPLKESHPKYAEGYRYVYYDGNNTAHYEKDDSKAEDNPSTKDIDESKVTLRYPEGRKEGAMYAEENSGVRILKYSPIPNLANDALHFTPDVPIIRLTEIQYMLAELYFNKGDKARAASLINTVRSRYFGKTVPSNGPDPNPVPADFDKYRLADEWLIEFIGEGRRRTDLVRWNMYTTESWWDHPADNADYKNRLPLSRTVLTSNLKLEQNPGYGK